MNFNPDMMLNILYQTHISCTLNNPICYNKLDVSNSHDVEDLDIEQITEKSFAKFEELKLPRGSVHLNPKIWTQIFFNVLKSNKGKTEINIPNGCCTNNHCPVKQYYHIIAEMIKKRTIS